MTSVPGDPLSGPDLDRFAHATFTHVRMREGYAMREVDAFVDRAVKALSSPVPTMRPEDVRAVRFSPVRLREGYDMAEVDTYLDDLEEQLARLVPDREPPPEEARPGVISTLGSSVVRKWAGRVAWVLVLAVVLLWLYANATHVR